MSGRLDLALRAAVAAALLVALFAARWDSSLQHFDWQVWEASSALLERGADPYDTEVLNRELQSNPDDYGPHFVESREMYLLNPPSWIVTVRAMATSPFVMSLIGGVAFLGSIVLLTRQRSLLDAIGLLAGAALFVFLEPGASTFRFGQTGLLVAGLIGVQFVLVGRTEGGLPIALLSSKPHMSFGLGVAELVRRPARTVVAIGVPLLLLVAVTTAVLGVDVWRLWLTGIGSGSIHPDITIGEMSIRTLSAHLPTGELGTWGVVLGAGASLALAHRCRTVDVRIVTLATLALMTYLSGHAFAHDWLWLPLVPVILGWDALRALAVTISVGTVLTVWNDVWLDDVIVNPRSVTALAVTAFLVATALRHERRDEPTGESEGVAAAQLVAP